MAIKTDQPEASTSTAHAHAPPVPTPGQTPYHETSQFRHWRYSVERLAQIRKSLNEKSVEVVGKNTEAEKQAQLHLGHQPTDAPSQPAYLTVEDELVLLRFYTDQTSKVCRGMFGLPETVEATAITYLKRFYLKNSCMEYHPRHVMPTCLFLAIKTTDRMVAIGEFVKQFNKLAPSDVLDLEFVVAQSLHFEFWVRGAEKALRGWSLELQNCPHVSESVIRTSLPQAFTNIQLSRQTDAELIYSPAQIGMASLRMANRELVDTFLTWRYATQDDVDGSAKAVYGVEKDDLIAILDEVEECIKAAGDGTMDLKVVKQVDKRLRLCQNPEKVPGTALYLKRKADQEATAAAARAAKTMKIQKEMSDREAVFGGLIGRQPVHPQHDEHRGDGPKSMGASGMGIKAESGGMMFGGEGLKDVGLEIGNNLDDDDA